jgi:ribonuclease HI
MDNTTQLPTVGTVPARAMPEDAILGGPVDIWTDGSCRPNPGKGGYAAILRNAEGHEKQVRGAELHTTNNRMELIAAISGLEALKRPCRVTMHSDSEYVCLGMTDWLPKWKTNRWRTNAGGPVVNADLWRRLVAAAAAHQVEWRLVKGHAGDPMNERVHRVANAARERLQVA